MVVLYLGTRIPEPKFTIIAQLPVLNDTSVGKCAIIVINKPLCDEFGVGKFNVKLVPCEFCNKYICLNGDGDSIVKLVGPLELIIVSTLLIIIPVVEIPVVEILPAVIFPDAVIELDVILLLMNVTPPIDPLVAPVKIPEDVNIPFDPIMELL